MGATTNLNIANTTVTSATYQDSLDVTAATSNAKLTLGTVANIGAGVDRDLVVTAAAAGDLAATLTLNLTSNANGVADLTNAALSAKTVTVTGAAYDFANASVATSLALGNIRVQSAKNLAVTNAVRTAAAYQDDLAVAATSSAPGVLGVTNPANVAAGATGNVLLSAVKAGVLDGTSVSLGLTSKALAISNLADGATTTQSVAAGLAGADATASIAAGQSGAVTFSVNAAGSLAGTTTLAFTSTALAGTGLNDASLTGASVAVTGTAYDFASAAFTNNATFAFGNLRVGATPAAKTLAFTNTLVVADAAYQDTLTVAGSANNAKLAVTGFTGLAAGASANLAIAASTVTAGSLAGTVNTVHTSVAAAGTGLANLGLGGGAATVTGAVYDFAKPTYAATIAFGNLRAGSGAVVRDLAVANTVLTSADYQDSLDVTGAVTATALSVVNPANILAGAAGNVTVTASTATAGSLADTLALTLRSNANGVTGLDSTDLTPGSVAITGAVYDFANPAVSTATVAFGNVHVGANLPAQTFTVTNAAKTNASYQDALAVATSSANAKVVASGADTLAAGAGNLTLTLTPTVATAGSLAGDVTLGFTSLAKSGTGLADATLTGSTVAVTGAAYDYAQPGYSTATLAFGNLRVGATPAAKSVAFTNAAVTDAAYQEALKVVATGAAGKFTATGFDSLAAGNGTAEVSVSAVTATAGLLNGNLALTLTSLEKAGTGLGNTGLTGGSIAVTGAVYDLARPAFTDGVVLAFGNAHVGDTIGAKTAAFANTLVTSADYQDTLRVIGSSGNAKVSTVDIASLGAGANANLTINASSAVAGSLAGDLNLALTSLAKSGTGLADVDLTAGKFTTTGAVYDYAQPTYVGTTLAFGNVRAGSNVAAKGIAVSNLVVTNADFQESLAVSAGSANTKLTLGGLAELVAGPNSGNLSVVASAATAGSLAGTVNLNFTSLAKSGTGLLDSSRGTGAVTVTGAVYDEARATVATSLALGNVRTAATGAINIANTVITSADFQDSLDVTATSSNGKLTVGTVGNILAGANADLIVTAAAAGDLAANVALTLGSNANGLAGLSNVGLAGQTVAVTGVAYDYAVSAVTNAPLAFGDVRKGATIANRTLTFGNTTVTDAAYQDALLVATT
ncbi:MAG: choice-of-anchor D domain-containing protein, partial [Betaproteobacteria bacterium]|nr:choice-of-anchor D domain-containing protein [Betaproteobacteria bacterium]